MTQRFWIRILSKAQKAFALQKKFRSNARMYIKIMTDNESTL